MDKNQMIPSEITSAIAQAANPNILVNQGDGIQILQNHGPIRAILKINNNQRGETRQDNHVGRRSERQIE